MKQTNRKGFTLAELLIVVAIIAVLVAIAIPVFTAQKHKSEVATDWANVRSYYSELQYDYITKQENDDTKYHIWGGTGLTSFELNGTTIELKAGQMWVAPNNNNEGYNLLYMCNGNHAEHSLILPEN